MVWDGIASGSYSTLSGINCCSMGILNKESGTNYNGSGIIAANGSSLTNCYYLNGIEGTTGITPETGSISFVKTSNDASAVTTAKVVDALNDLIENPPEGVDTTGWCKWVIGEDNLPALDFSTEWNGTTWVSTNN